MCILLTRINNAPPEVDDLLYHIRGLGALINETARLLRARREDREENAEATPNELAAENWLRSVVYECLLRLRQMKRTFVPLKNVRDEVPVTQMQDTLGLDPNTGFFKKQQAEIEWQHRNITVALQMLDFHRNRGDRARFETERAEFAQLVQLLQERLAQIPENQLSDPVALDETTDVETVPSHSGETGMPEPDEHINYGSGAGDDPIDSPISGNGEAIFGSTGEPSHEEVESSNILEEIRKRNIDKVEQILETSPPENIRVRDKDDWTVLHYAVLQGDVSLLELLLQRPEIRDPEYLNAKNSSGYTALMDACRKADQARWSKLAHLLLGVDQCEVNIRDDTDQKRSALYLVVERPPNKSSTSVANALLNKNADIVPVFEGLPHNTGYAEVNKAIQALKQRRRQARGSFRGIFQGNAIPR